MSINFQDPSRSLDPTTNTKGQWIKVEWAATKKGSFLANVKRGWGMGGAVIHPLYSTYYLLFLEHSTFRRMSCVYLFFLKRTKKNPKDIRQDSEPA